MGYTTKFKGVLHFSQPMTGEQLRWLGALLDDYDHEWLAALVQDTGYKGKDNERGDFRHYVDLQLTKDLTGLEWNPDTEKNSGMVAALNVLQHALLVKFPDNPVHLEGQMIARGEDSDDIWAINAAGGTITRSELPAPHEICCPKCRAWFEVSKGQQRGQK